MLAASEVVSSARLRRTEAMVETMPPALLSLRSSAVIMALAVLADSRARRLKVTVPEMVTALRGLVAKVTTLPAPTLVNWVAAVGGVTGPASVFLT